MATVGKETNMNYRATMLAEHLHGQANGAS